MYCPFCGSVDVKIYKGILYCSVCNTKFKVTKINRTDTIECRNCKNWNPIDETTGYCSVRSIITTVNYKCRYNLIKRRRSYK